jgi:hypothetical protein
VASAAAPPSIAVDVTAQNSSGGVTPLLTGENWRYAYEITAGGSVTDTLPISICSTSAPNTAGATGYPLVLSMGPNGQGGNLPGVTYPATVTFAADGCQTINIALSTGDLSSGNYNKEINIQKGSSTPPNTQVSLNNDNIHIQVKVTEPENPISCFITDSSFNFLAACDGSVVTSGDGGRFAIVTNKKGTQVATNPGQFYYNVLWTNTSGSEKTIDVSFARNGVNPQGAQAIHAEVFPAFPDFSSDNFNSVNDAIPGGSDDAINAIVVPAGWTLWVDYHLEWAALGSNNPISGTSCSSAGSAFSVTATVSDDQTSSTCGAGASGYKK